MALRLFSAIAGLGLLAAPVAVNAQTVSEAARAEGQAELAKMLEGRVAGEPQDCIRDFRGNTDMKIIDGTALVFGRGHTIYVNIPQTPSTLSDNDRLVIRKLQTSQLCRTTMITTEDRLSNFFTGNVLLNEFVPYTRQDTNERD